VIERRRQLSLTPVRTAVLCGATAALASLAFALRAASTVEAVCREEVLRMGRYVATELATVSSYGVVFDDGPVLRSLADDLLGGSGPDVVGVVVRHEEGSILTQAWRPGQSLLHCPV